MTVLIPSTSDILMSPPAKLPLTASIRPPRSTCQTTRPTFQTTCSTWQITRLTQPTRSTCPTTPSTCPTCQTIPPLKTQSPSNPLPQFLLLAPTLVPRASVQNAKSKNLPLDHGRDLHLLGYRRKSAWALDMVPKLSP